MHGSNILLFAALLLILVQSTAVESAVGDSTRGGKPDKDTSNDIVQQAIEDGECDEYDLLCIEARSLNPIAVSVEDILSSSWESKKRALVSSSRIKVVGRHKGNNGQVKVRRLLTKDGRSCGILRLDQPHIASLPTLHLQDAFEHISSLPSLRHLIVQPNILAEFDKFSIRSRTVSWLLSVCSGLETLVVFDLDLYDNTDVRRLTDSITRCNKLQSIELRRTNVGAKIDSTSSFFEALVAMKNLRDVTIELGSIVGGEQALGKHSAAGLATLESGRDELRGSKFARNGEYHVISNNEARLDEIVSDPEGSKRVSHDGDADLPQEMDKSEL